MKNNNAPSMLRITLPAEIIVPSGYSLLTAAYSSNMGFFFVQLKEWKERTTPDQYPLTLNALVSACNQSTSREPVMRVIATSWPVEMTMPSPTAR